MSAPEEPPRLGVSDAELTELARFPEMNPWPVCRLDRDGVVRLANGAARDLFGPAPLVGRGWLDICPGMTTELWADILDGDEAFVYEANVADRAFLLTHVRSPGGDSVFVYGADVTARRRYEQLLEEHAALLANVARFPEMNPGPVLRMDLDGIVVLANSAARALFQSELVGECWWTLCPQIDAPFWQQTLASEGATSIEARIGDRDYVLTHRYDTRAALVFVFGADVTLQKQAERALRQTEKMATLGTMAAGVAHELNNPAAATRRAAWQLAEAIGRQQAASARLGRLPLSTTAAEAMTELVSLTRTPADRRQSLDPVALADREADLEDWLEAHDVPDPWELAPSLAAQGISGQALDRLAAEAAPDALLAVVTAVASAHPVRVLLDEIERGSARISDIVTAFKGYTYLDQAPIQLIDLHEGLDNTLVILERRLRPDVTVRRRYAQELPRILACGGELNQVWTHLIDNAVEAMDGRGTITITTRPMGDRVCVEIEDEGPGIAAEDLPRIFDPFFTTKAPGRGTGLGLSTCHTIVTEKHRGRIAVESAPGRTVFAVLLPLRPEGVRP